MSESALMRMVMRAASDVGARLFRNNVGRWRTENGPWITYGVCNPGGSDLIGWYTVVINGRRVAVFTAVETKSTTGRLTNAQRAFLKAVRNAGGIAIEARDVHEAIDQITNYSSLNGRT